MIRVLVTGGTGGLGCEVVSRLLEKEPVSLRGRSGFTAATVMRGRRAKSLARSIR